MWSILEVKISENLAKIDPRYTLKIMHSLNSIVIVCLHKELPETGGRQS